jgi:hypothetical protein
MIRSRSAQIGCGLASALLTLTLSAPLLAAPPAIAEGVAAVQKDATIDLKLESLMVDSVPFEKLQVLPRGAQEPLPNAVKTDSTGTSKVNIPKSSSVVIRKQPATPSAKDLSSKETTVDSVLVESVPIAGTEKVQTIRQWTLAIYASQTPLVWDAARHAYTTELLVKLEELGQTEGASPSTPVTVQLVGKGVAIEPSTLRLSESGVSGIQPALVSLSSHREKGTVVAISDFGEQSYVVSAAPELASLDLKSSLTSIPGFGIGTTLLSAVRRAEDGRELLGPAPLSVTLTATGGRLDSPSLVIPANASRSPTVELRSSWLGGAHVSASVDGVDAPALDIQFSTPWSYLLAILLGAAIGSYVRVRPKSKAHGPDFTAGVGVGLVLGSGSFIGISSIVGLPSTAVVTELGCLVVAALEAYAGRVALERFAGGAARSVPAPKPV